MTTIPTSLFSFLTELKTNNNREWFEEHKSEFNLHQQIVKSFGVEIQMALNKTDEVDGVKVFRIYRDVRFSNDKTPYKTHFGVSFHRKKPHLRGGYYIHIKPGETFIAVGLWDPHKDDLFRIRKEMEFYGDEMRKLLKNKHLIKYWGALEGEEVKSAPKGFSKEHLNIDLIKKKQFIFTKSFHDHEVVNENFQHNVIDHFLAIRPFFDYMSEVLTTNLNGESIL